MACKMRKKYMAMNQKEVCQLDSNLLIWSVYLLIMYRLKDFWEQLLETVGISRG